MTKRTIQIIFLTVAAMLLILGCGHRKSPTGGKKDTVKPEILSISPLELSDISDSDIEVVFSKPIERNTIISGLYIYPPILQKKFKWDKNVLTIKILEKLEENTNYFFTFQTSIKGEHNNELDKQYTYIFSSGKLNDNRISGKLNWEKNEDKNLKVNFTLMAPDSTFITSQIINTSAFEFTNLNNTDHILEAYADKNRNKKYDYGDEPYFYAYLDSAEFTSINVEMAYEDTLKPAIRSANAVWDNQVQITFDEPVLDFSKVEITTKDSFPKKHDILSEYLEIDVLTLITSKMDTLQYIAYFYDLLDTKNNINDSVSIVFDGAVINDSIPPVILDSYPKNGDTIKESYQTFSIVFDEIIRNTDLNISLQDMEQKKTVPIKIVQADSKLCKFVPLHDLDNYSSYKLSILANDFNENEISKPYEIDFIVIFR
ncbi:MAG: Ig-like domain-containing protein [Candidatus Cloacimonetes bacterium]|nr:Ig-like domain-containing protein [Candidatus Cloacimonadota bacterium]MCF7812852.1 Ig-like domain-containing protein [Candidatus Cloacimonadota bacterium]MCF7867064.1 Ig-like domain-containing protein [Candidatus Cloacimonadota bacterium]MCF7882616.1 Ig-like domain-containing protein [Candidatus Cloacimonadota bacterium]